MMQNKRIHEDVFSFLETLPPKQRAQITTKILKLFNDPRPHDSIKIKGREGYYRVDSGEYRVCYTFIDGELVVDVVDKRNDDTVYKKLYRK